MDRTGHSPVTGVRIYTANKVGKSAEYSVDDQTPVLCNKPLTNQPISESDRRNELKIVTGSAKTSLIAHDGKFNFFHKVTSIL